MSTITGHDPVDITRVPGHLFTPNGKWKYDVDLDYTGLDLDHWDLASLAEQALATATRNRTSGVTISALENDWKLVVINPPGRYSHPIIAGSRAAHA